MGTSLAATDRPAQFEAVHSRQHDVDQHDVGGVALERLDGVLAGRGRLHRPALVFEGQLERAPDPLVVLDCQDARTHARLVWHVTPDLAGLSREPVTLRAVSS